MFTLLLVYLNNYECSLFAHSLLIEDATTVMYSFDFTPLHTVKNGLVTLLPTQLAVVWPFNMLWHVRYT